MHHYPTTHCCYLAGIISHELGARSGTCTATTITLSIIIALTHHYRSTTTAPRVLPRQVSAGELRRDPELSHKFETSIVLLKYYERWGAHYWQNRWAREMRGVVLFVCPITDRVRLR